jgi:hypothetical protein
MGPGMPHGPRRGGGSSPGRACQCSRASAGLVTTRGPSVAWARAVTAPEHPIWARPPASSTSRAGCPQGARGRMPSGLFDQ